MFFVLVLFKLILHKKGTLVEESKRAIAFRLDQFHKEHAGERIIILFDFTSAGVTNMVIIILNNYVQIICV